MQETVTIVEPEEQGSDHAPLAGVAETPHHAVRRALALHLLHARPLAGAVLEVHALGHDPVERAAGHAQPSPRHLDVRRLGRHLHVLDRRQFLSREGLERSAPLAERAVHEGAAARIHEHVEDDQDGRPLLGQLPDASLRGMDPLEEIVE